MPSAYMGSTLAEDGEHDSEAVKAIIRMQHDRHVNVKST